MCLKEKKKKLKKGAIAPPPKKKSTPLTSNVNARSAARPLDCSFTVVSIKSRFPLVSVMVVELASRR